MEKIFHLLKSKIVYDLDSVLSCGVVAMKDEKWGEVPCVFIELKPEAKLSKQQQLNIAGQI